jgi:hypothetical protein
MKTLTPLGFTLLAALGGSSAALAQAPAPCGAGQSAVPSPSGAAASVQSDTTGPAAANATQKPDVLLLVSFSADELRFNSAPDASIRFCWGGDSLRVVERRNLPSPVVGGTTYRNVYIAAELRAYLNPECLTRALGLSTSALSPGGDPACAALGITVMRPVTSVSTPPNVTAH